MGADEVRADPVELARLADRMLRTSQTIADAWRLARDPMTVAVTAFGDSSAGRSVHDLHEATVDDGDVAIGRMVSVLEGDMDRLYQVTFAYRRADENAARAFAHHHRVPD